MYVKKIYNSIRPVFLSFSLAVLGLLFLSFTYSGNECPQAAPSPCEKPCFHNPVAQSAVSLETTLEKADPDQPETSSVFIRTRGTIKSAIRHISVTTDNMPGFPPIVCSIDITPGKTAILRPAYYNFLFRYTLF
jgi:hypothetical protein